MKKLPLFLIVTLIGCGSGGAIPGGDQTINVTTSQDQDQTNNQNQNQPEVECTRACTTETDGGSNLTSNCSGAGSEVLAIYATFGECAATIQQETITGDATNG